MHNPGSLLAFHVVPEGVNSIETLRELAGRGTLREGAYAAGGSRGLSQWVGSEVAKLQSPTSQGGLVCTWEWDTEYVYTAIKHQGSADLGSWSLK